MTDRPQTREEWARLLERRIEQSGLSDNRFAREVLRRGERTIARWKSREQDIPNEVKDFLLDPQKAPWP